MYLICPAVSGVISEELIAEIVAQVPPPIATFLLTSSQHTQEIIRQIKCCGTNTVQICDNIESGNYQDIREALPGISIVQVIHVTEKESINQAIKISPFVDAILLDSGNQSLSIKELGGTGRIHNWDISRKIREQIKIPIFLAGGLKPENIALAVTQVAPFAVDVCSGVRSNDKLDKDKLKRFFEQLN